MQNLHFCPQCGTSLQVGDLFCPSCGFALSQIQQIAKEPTPEEEMSEEEILLTPSPRRMPTQPVPVPNVSVPNVSVSNVSVPNVSFARRLLPLLVVVFIGSVAGWYWWQKQSAPPNIATSDTGTRPAPSSDIANSTTPQESTDPLLAPPSKSGAIQLDDFVGVWRAYEANDSQEIEVKLGDPETDLFIENHNGKLVLYPRKEKEQTHDANVSCSPLQAATVSCKVKDNGADFTLKLELQPDKNEMIISEIPDMPSELVILKAKRLDEAVSSASPSRGTESYSGTPEVPVPLSQSFFPPIKGPVTEKQAIERVKYAPDVKDWLQQIFSKGGKPFIVIDHQENGAYIVRAYEIVYNGTEYSHQATIGWYSVNKQTGVVDFYIP